MSEKEDFGSEGADSWGVAVTYPLTEDTAGQEGTADKW